jgi:hypothetical protein
LIKRISTCIYSVTDSGSFRFRQPQVLLIALLQIWLILASKTELFTICYLTIVHTIGFSYWNRSITEYESVIRQKTSYITLSQKELDQRIEVRKRRYTENYCKLRIINQRRCFYGYFGEHKEEKISSKYHFVPARHLM